MRKKIRKKESRRVNKARKTKGSLEFGLLFIRASHAVSSLTNKKRANYLLADYYQGKKPFFSSFQLVC